MDGIEYAGTAGSPSQMPSQWSDDILVSELSDEPALSEELSSVIDGVSERGVKSPHVVLNFQNVSYIGSSNLAQLIRLRKLLKDAGRQMRICGVNDEIWSVFMVSGLDKVFRFSPDPLTALAGLQIEDTRELP